MAYTSKNYKTKKALREAVRASGGKFTMDLLTFNPSGLFPVRQNGVDVIEGPQNTRKGHSWYAEVEVRDGQVIKVRS